MAQLLPTQRVVIPCVSKQAALTTLRRVTAVSRYPTEMAGREFSGRMVTVVGELGEAFVGVEIVRLK